MVNHVAHDAPCRRLYSSTTFSLHRNIVQGGKSACVETHVRIRLDSTCCTALAFTLWVDEGDRSYVSSKIDAFPSQAERRAYREAEISVMDDLSEADFQKEDDPASPAPPPPPPPPPSQQHTDPASPTVALTPEPVARGDQPTPSEIEYQVPA